MANVEKLGYTLSIKQMIQNPTGKGSGHTAARYLIKDSLDKKYAELISTHGGFEFELYTTDKQENIIYHIKVPSESINLKKPFYYDVIIDIDTDLDVKNTSDLPMKVYSNSMAFVFTYAYILYNQDLIPEYMYKKMNKMSQETPPSVRNPVEEMGFEKSIYYACKYIVDKELTNLVQFGTMIKKFNKTKFLSNIQDFDDKLASYNKLKIKVKKNLKSQKNSSNIQKVSGVDTLNKVGTLNQVSTIKGTTNITKTKSVKKIGKK